MTFDVHSLDVYPFVNYTEMRVNEYYVNYYINWSRNIVTGVLPIVSLIIFNQLVYKKLEPPSVEKKVFVKLLKLAVENVYFVCDGKWF